MVIKQMYPSYSRIISSKPSEPYPQQFHHTYAAARYRPLSNDLTRKTRGIPCRVHYESLTRKVISHDFIVIFDIYLLSLWRVHRLFGILTLVVGD